LESGRQIRECKAKGKSICTKLAQGYVESQKYIHEHPQERGWPRAVRPLGGIGGEEQTFTNRATERPLAVRRGIGIQ
jgi:hypothetical protein